MFVFIACLYLLLSKSIIHEALSTVVVLDKGIFTIEEGSVGIQFFVDIQNNNRWSSCRIHSWPKVCCLADEPFKDCCTNSIYGDNIESVMPKRRETLIYVYPTLVKHDQVGYCDFVVDFRCGNKKRSAQLHVNIPFDTKLNNKKPLDYLKILSKQRKSECRSLDEDALDECVPVNCDLKYSGRRPFFDRNSGKCVRAPTCKTNLQKNLPDIVYVPKSNLCRDLEQSMTLSDIYAIKTGLGVVAESRKNSVNNLKVQLKSNCSTISQNLVLLKDLMTGKLCPLFKGDTTAYSDCCKTALLSIFACIGTVCLILISLICIIHALIWLSKKISNGEISNVFQKCKAKMKEERIVSQKPSQLCRDVTDNLLKEILVRDLPLELRGSVVEICDRISKEVGRKKRYRMAELGSQVNLMEDGSETTSATSSGRSRHQDEE